MTEAPPVASLRDVSHRYGDRHALDSVSIAIPSGCVAGLIGPDGVGKSTLLALIAGVRRIQTGAVMALGGDMASADHRAAVCGRIAYMPQGLGRNLNPALTVGENLDFFARLFGQADARQGVGAQLLAATDLAAFVDRPAGKLSGGMKQKLGLCCALIHAPDLLILDEPTTGVDPLSRRQFWRLIDRIRADRPGMSVLTATAYMDEASRFDWLVALDGGKLIASGAPAAIMAQTGCDRLENAFIQLLPPEKRARHVPVVVPPRTAGDGTIALEARSLSRKFGDFTAVDAVNFQIERGEIFGFLGSNGCGKTTTMKMITGLQPASAGQALLFGKPLQARDMETRRRVGYMSQGFSLYGELTVRQNLELQGQLYGVEGAALQARIAALMTEFDLADLAAIRPEALPLGVRQRLQLAAAILHEPEILILDEPTSGVDPIARDAFWQSLITLSRERGVTIFVSTHFMNEAERCDRICLMHAGRLLATGAPADLAHEGGAQSLEDAVIRRLEQESPEVESGPIQYDAAPEPRTQSRLFDVRRLLAYARREALELRRDPIRLGFALLGPLFLMLAFGYGISFDVENLAFAVYDQDQSLESRSVIEAFSGSRYFKEHPPILAPAEIDRRLSAAEISLAIEIPAGFGRRLMRGEATEIAVWVDGAMPFRGATIRTYVAGLLRQEMAALQLTPQAGAFSVETRFLYNQAFASVFAILPGIVMLTLMLIPAMMTAVAVVRERETGSIANFRASPVTRLEFLVGKQLSYLLVAFVSFWLMLALARGVFGVTVKGSTAALAVGAALYLFASTGFGLLMSAFTRTQVAAVFATAIISIIPAVNFSGMLTPVSSLTGGGPYIGAGFPSSWFQQISVGAFAKGLGFADLWLDMVVLAGFGALYLLAALACLRKQEA